MSFWLCTTIWTDYDTLVLDRLCHSGYEQTYVTLVMNRLCHSVYEQTMSLWFWTDYVTMVLDRLMSLWFWTDLCHSGYEQTNVTQVYYWLRTSCLIRHNTSKCRQVLVNLGLGSFFPWVCPSPWNIVFYNLIHKKNWGLSCSLSFKYLSGLHTWQTSSAKYLRGSGIPLTITITIIEKKGVGEWGGIPLGNEDQKQKPCEETRL